MKSFLDQLTGIIEANLTNDRFGVSELAREMHMSRSSLHRKVKDAAGISVSQFICRVRLRKACMLLTKGSLTISETAFACGFHSVTYFTKCFRDFYGMSPGQYKKDKAPKKSTAHMKTNVFYFHGYSELLLNEKWVKATPVFDKYTSEKAGYPLVEFDGENNALLAPNDEDGKVFVEYINDRGVFPDFPYEEVEKEFNEKYSEAIEELKSRARSGETSKES